MKKKIIITAGILCLMVVLMNSCRFNQNSPFLRSMVSAYGIQPKELKLIGMEEGVISMSVSTSSIVYYSYTGKDKIIYDTWCRKHGDMSYNREEIYYSRSGLPHEFIAADYTAIDIVSDSDWDAEHPAGTSLNDITMFLSASPKKYIDSGYKDKYDWKNGSHEYDTERYFGSYYNAFVETKDKNPYHPVEKLASGLRAKDMVLLGNGVPDYPIALLRFTFLPTENKTHNITVTLTTDEGEVFSDTINMTFE